MAPLVLDVDKIRQNLSKLQKNTKNHSKFGRFAIDKIVRDVYNIDNRTNVLYLIIT